MTVTNMILGMAASAHVQGVSFDRLWVLPKQWFRLRAEVEEAQGRPFSRRRKLIALHTCFGIVWVGKGRA